LRRRGKFPFSVAARGAGQRRAGSVFIANECEFHLSPVENVLYQTGFYQARKKVEFFLRSAIFFSKEKTENFRVGTGEGAPAPEELRTNFQPTSFYGGTMHVLAINGSPRPQGNTELLLRAVLDPLAGAGWETEFFQLGGRPIKGCLACGKCRQNRDRKCSNTSDIFNTLMERMIGADAIVLGSPTYFADVTAEMKALIDRSGFVAMANGRLFAGKIGAAVVAVRRGGATHVFDTINHMLFLSQMLVPGSTYWNMGYGLEKGEVESDAEGLANMRHLGRVIDWLGRAVAARGEEYPRAG
jgi:multimeric flavodoxin WrbA